ncbi:nucleolar complex-associated protein 2 [Rutidosis leptorrhynchoides]|uniref:nucleolar complex-associated protein 2 n=1 Tax=Rutidosis leptorrhynchoides TaxID=125765 RepID=UPI003A990814
MGSKKKDKKLNKSSVKDEQKEKIAEEAPVENAKDHKTQLQRLSEKDPEFYEFLKEHDKELLEFDDEGDAETDVDDEESQKGEDEEDDPMDQNDGLPKEKHIKTVTSEMVDSWCKAIREERRIGAIRNIMRAFRSACHCGDDDHESKLTSMSFPVFNKILLFVLSEMDGILRSILKLPLSGGKKEMIIELMNTRAWKNYNHLVKSYLGNALHVLNQMTDTDMIAFTLRRLKFSSVFLAAFPSLLRKYIKVVLHFWGTGGGALPIVSLLFLRDVCVRLGSDCIDECFKGIYKAYVLNCHFVNATKLQHVQFLGNCVNELFRVDLPSAYQHAFVFIRQLAMILREAFATKRKEVFRKVYEWKYMNCLQLWTGAIYAYGLEADFKPLAYPLTQIISGAVRLAPTARYLPLRLRCIRMLNQIAAATNTFIPVAVLLTDMLDMKELHKPPTGGVGKAVDLRTILRVSKATIKTRSFQESCVFSVIEELAEHLAQWSYSPAFFELSFVPAVRLRNFCKSTKVERFRREIRQLIREIEANCEFTNKKRMSFSCLPNDPSVSSFMEDEKKKGASPLSKYVATLRQKAQLRNDSLAESSVIVGEKASIFGKKRANKDDDDDDDDDDVDEEDVVDGAAVFSSSWLPSKDHKAKDLEEDVKGKKGKKRQKQKGGGEKAAAGDEDVVEDFVLSSDEEESSDDDENAIETQEDVKKKATPLKNSKRKGFEKSSKRKRNFYANNKKSKKRNKAN